jgi:hypothetical protein
MHPAGLFRNQVVVLKGTHPGSIPARLSLIWFIGFRGEDLNVKVYDGRQVMAKAQMDFGQGPPLYNTVVTKYKDYCQM